MSFKKYPIECPKCEHKTLLTDDDAKDIIYYGKNNESGNICDKCVCSTCVEYNNFFNEDNMRTSIYSWDLMQNKEP